MTECIDRLEADEEATRRQNPDDHRSVLIALSPKGLALIDAMLEDHLATQTDLVKSLSADERAVLSGLLKSLMNDLQQD